jgi:hypothetical protein
VLVRPQRWFEGFANLGLDEGERAAGQPGGEGAGPGDVAVARQAASGERVHRRQAQGWFPRGYGDPDPVDRPVRDGRAWPGW